MNRLLWKNLYSEIRRTFMRFLSIFAICALGVAFFAGIRATSPDMKEAANRYFNRMRLADITVMCTSGLTEDDVRALRALEGVEAVRPQVHTDALMSAGETEYNIRLISLPIAEPEENSANPFKLPSLDIDTEPENPVNELELVYGRLPVDDHEVALDMNLSGKIALGDTVVFRAMGSEAELRVVGFCYSASYVSLLERGSSTVGSGSCDAFAYASGNAVGSLGGKLPMMGMLTTRYTEATIRISGSDEMSAFSEEYRDAVSAVTRRIEEYGEKAGGVWYVQSRSSNPGYTDYSENTERIAAVGKVFPLIFFLVAALVSLTTMTRMVEEQRIEMGTLKALGYRRGAIIGKYLYYAVFASLSGGIVGCLIGFKLFPVILSKAYNIMYRIPDFQTPFRADIALASIIAATGCTAVATLGAAWNALRAVPAALMRPKAPKPGKRVFVERIVFLWRRMGFTAKVTVRNLLRYKKRFWMSVVGIAGSCALLVTGFGLKDSIFGIITEQFGELWKMDLQAYAYDVMPKDEMAEIAAGSFGENAVDNIAYCYDKPMEAEQDGVTMGNVHLFGVEDAEALRSLIAFRDGKTPPELTEEGAVVTRKLAEKFGLKEGGTLTLVTGGGHYDVPVAGITDNYVYHYVYMTPGLYEKVFGKAMEYNGFLVSFQTALETDEEKDALAERILADGRMYTVAFTDGIYDTVWDSLSILNYVVMVLIVGSALLTFVVMLNLTNINITERQRELATLRVLGFHDREMYDYVFRENNALAFIGAAAGLLLGVVLHQFVIKTCEVDLVMFVRAVEPLSFVYSFVLTICSA